MDKMPWNGNDTQVWASVCGFLGVKNEARRRPLDIRRPVRRKASASILEYSHVGQETHTRDKQAAIIKRLKMLLNKATAISTSNILLVPYEQHHVPTYHEWMLDDDVRSATASEPLSLDEEFSMQKSWRRDTDKLTFIACLPLRPSQEGMVSRKHDTSTQMVGDVNLFLENFDNEDEQGVVGEVELMIARKEHQGKGLGKATLLAFLIYVAEHEHELVNEFLSEGLATCKVKGQQQMKHLRAKIGQDNVRSIRLFEAFGFRRTDERPNYFGEYELRLEGPLSAQLADLMDRFGRQQHREEQLKEET